MPYIVHVPQIPRPYITNNPSIFIDCQSWNWNVESRPYNDPFCQAVRKQENARYESDRRVEQLEQFWRAEVERQQRLKDVQANVQTTVVETDAIKGTATVQICGKHAKNDSVHGAVEFMEPKGSAIGIVQVIKLDA